MRLHCSWCGSDNVRYLHTDYPAHESQDGQFDVYLCDDCGMKYDMEIDPPDPVRNDSPDIDAEMLKRYPGKIDGDF